MEDMIYKEWRRYLAEHKRKNEPCKKKEDSRCEYPSEKERKRLAKLGKPSPRSWTHGKSEMDSLANGIMEDSELDEDIDSLDAKYLRGILSQELKKALAGARSSSGCSLQQLLRAVNVWAQAEKGNLGGKEK